MAGYVDKGYRTFTAGTTMSRGLRVKLTANTLALAGVGASDNAVEIGTVVDNVLAIGDPANVSLRNRGGTTRMVASAEIAVGVAVYGAASGKIATTVSGNPIGIALEFASGNNSIIEVLRF